MATIRPDSKYTDAFHEFVNLLRETPSLARVVKTWRAWDGDSKADDPPTQAQMPMVRLTPLARPIELVASFGGDRDVTDAMLGVAVECWVPGYDVADLMNLWGLIELAATSGRSGQWVDPQFVYLRTPALPTQVNDLGEGILFGSGEIDILLYSEG